MPDSKHTKWSSCETKNKNSLNTTDKTTEQAKEATPIKISKAGSRAKYKVPSAGLIVFLPRGANPRWGRREIMHFEKSEKNPINETKKQQRSVYIVIAASTIVVNTKKQLLILTILFSFKEYISFRTPTPQT